ncbi:MAG: hypothetical protein ACW96U_13890 [Candidatus Heimdallarchaeaceae archaeon]|jgi:hypothetical protein
MRIGKILRYVELILIALIVISPIIFFTTPLSLDARFAKIGFEEGDIIQITITDYSFDYNVTVLGNYTITAGIYLNPIIDFKEGVYYIADEQYVSFNNIKLFEGNLSTHLQYRFRIDSISKKKTTANVLLEHNNRNFTLGLFEHYQSAIIPFFEPSLAIGLTFRSDNGTFVTSYVYWRSFFLFQTEDLRDALNWHSKNNYRSPYDFAQEDSKTYYTLYANSEVFSLTTYSLSQFGNKLREITSVFEGTHQITSYSPFYSNITHYLGISDLSYWKYRITLEYQYFRGGAEI